MDIVLFGAATGVSCYVTWLVARHGAPWVWSKVVAIWNKITHKSG